MNLRNVAMIIVRMISIPHTPNACDFIPKQLVYPIFKNYELSESKS